MKGTDYEFLDYCLRFLQKEFFNKKGFKIAKA